MSSWQRMRHRPSRFGVRFPNRDSNVSEITCGKDDADPQNQRPPQCGSATSVSIYSCLSAFIGSSRDALRAGR